LLNSAGPYDRFAQLITVTWGDDWPDVARYNAEHLQILLASAVDHGLNTNYYDSSANYAVVTKSQVKALWIHLLKTVIKVDVYEETGEVVWVCFSAPVGSKLMQQIQDGSRLRISSSSTPTDEIRAICNLSMGTIRDIIQGRSWLWWTRQLSPFPKQCWTLGQPFYLRTPAERADLANDLLEERKRLRSGANPGIIATTTVASAMSARASSSRAGLKSFSLT
jgi:hypothetical protein